MCVCMCVAQVCVNMFVEARGQPQVFIPHVLPSVLCCFVLFCETGSLTGLRLASRLGWLASEPQESVFTALYTGVIRTHHLGQP